LQEHDTLYEERDMLQQPFARDELDALIGDRPAARFLNNRHPRYRESGWAENPPSREEAIRLMLEDPNLIQRPILRRGDRFVFGPDEEGWADLAGIGCSGPS
jgi:arsenate reductase-like glutaredoxin family protein